MRFSLLFLLLLIVFCLQPFSTDARALETLQTSDCIKCHYTIVQTFAAHGQAHAAQLTCQKCHQQHPPQRELVIPQCSQCHTGRSHFDKLTNCLQCHNPHRPLDIVLPNRLTEPCLTCHPSEGELLKKFPSAHSILGCTACHKKHGWIPSCFRCHLPHTEEMQTPEDCNRCHAAHKPLQVSYEDTTPSSICAMCHPKVLATLRASQAKHHSFECAFCHKRKHRTIPACQDCHGKPHSDFILSKADSCGFCHNIAHDLIF